MKIAIIDTTMDGELIGGAQTFLPDFIAGFIKTGNEVHLITKGLPNPKIRREIEQSGVILHTNLWQGRFVEENVPILAVWLNNLLPDIFLISVSPDIGWAVLPLLDPKIATVTIGHTDAETFYLPAKHYNSFLTCAVGVSPEVCSNYNSICNIDNKRIEWIPYGVKASEHEPNDNGDEDVLKIVYVGRLDEEQKRISDLIKVVKLLSKREISFELSIIGDGAEMPALQRDLSEEIKAGKVKLHGWLKSDKVLEILRKSEVFILTSAYEGFCIALVESMANGCCPVATNIKSGNSELIKSGQNGFLIEIGNAEEFAEKLEYLSWNSAKLLKMRKLSWQTGKNYSVAQMVENYKSCFEKAVVEAQAAPREIDAEFPLMDSCRSRYPLWLRRIKAKTKQFISVA